MAMALSPSCGSVPAPSQTHPRNAGLISRSSSTTAAAGRRCSETERRTGEVAEGLGTPRMNAHLPLSVVQNARQSWCARQKRDETCGRMRGAPPAAAHLRTPPPRTNVARARQTGGGGVREEDGQNGRHESARRAAGTRRGESEVGPAALLSLLLSAILRDPERYGKAVVSVLPRTARLAARATPS
ncbi:hypothetical protein B0H13DRAFT_2110217 [Mycena leptocephala]|nr:hypothetical protein B0H13DRAFT_2110217 [Mycena leptocephala]